MLAIKLTIKQELRAEWLQRWGVLAEHVKKSEPKTLAYEALEIEGQPDTFLVYERSASPNCGAETDSCNKAKLFQPAVRPFYTGGIDIFVTHFVLRQETILHAGTARSLTFTTLIKHRSRSRNSDSGAQKKTCMLLRRYRLLPLTITCCDGPFNGIPAGPCAVLTWDSFRA